MTQRHCFDFHLHTEWSYDALSKVEEYFQFAEELKLRAIAITDHHTMDGYGDVLEAARRHPDVRFVAGAELTVHCPLGTYDLVCLNLPCVETGELVGLFQTYRAWQVACGHAFSENMVRLGFDFDDEARLKLLQSYRAPRIIAKQGNTHVRYSTKVQELIRRGFCKDVEGYKKLANQFTDMPDYPEYNYVVPIVKRAGGVVFLAHPVEYVGVDMKRMEELRELFQLDGVECANGVPEEIVPVYRKFCTERHLLSTAGTDLHTPDRERFTCHGGDDAWLDEILERVELH